MTDSMPATMITAIVAGIALASPAIATAQDDPPLDDASTPAPLSVRVEGLESRTRPAFHPTTVSGTVGPFVPGQSVRVRIVRGRRVIVERQVRVREAPGAGHGTFSLRSPRLSEPGRYHVIATHGGTEETAQPFRLRYPELTRGDRGRAVEALHRRLREAGYRAPRGRRFTAATARAVLAFRKVNRMEWTRRASPDVLTRLLRGRGAFKLRYPSAKRHVEVDLARQVLVLAQGRRPRFTFHISSGAPSTPSDRGHFRFYRRVPGYNRLGMLDAVYYNRGEALHGYRSVPTYPASHGCVRSAVPDARLIYDWVRLGMSIHVY